MSTSVTMRCVAAHAEVEADEVKVRRSAQRGLVVDMVLPGHSRAKDALAAVATLVRAGYTDEALSRLEMVPCWLRGPEWHDLRRSLIRKSVPPPDDHPTLPPPPA